MFFSLTRRVSWVDPGDFSSAKVGARQTSYFIEARLYFRAYDFNCRCGLRLYFFPSFTGARSTAPSRKRQSPLKPRTPACQVPSSTFFFVFLPRPLTDRYSAFARPLRALSGAPLARTPLCVRCLIRQESFLRPSWPRAEGRGRAPASQLARGLISWRSSRPGATRCAIHLGFAMSISTGASTVSKNRLVILGAREDGKCTSWRRRDPEIPR